MFVSLGSGWPRWKTNERYWQERHMTQILIVEDSPTQSAHLAAILRSKAYGVRVFAHAGAALDEIDAGATFDLYLLDVTMPVGELHGLALARMIKTRFSNARIIFVTADPGLVSDLDKKLGPVFPKTIDFIELLNEIERQLAKGP
jgi:CheY-like chemotaxis protein